MAPVARSTPGRPRASRSRPEKIAYPPERPFPLRRIVSVTDSLRLLDGLTVLDFTRVLAGPYCTRLLADLGARVLKIERPGEGDDTRRGYIQLEEGRPDQATYFVRINVGKEGVGVDLSNPRGRSVALDTARKPDVPIGD